MYIKPTHPSEIPIRGSFAPNIASANHKHAQFSSDPIDHDPRLKLDLDSVIERFGLTHEQTESLVDWDDSGKRALMVVGWMIDKAIEDLPILTDTDREIAVQDDIDSKYKNNDYVDSFYDDLKRQPAQEVEFNERIDQYLTLANLVLSGNEFLKGVLSEEFDRQVDDEVFWLKSERDPVIEAKKRMDEEHGWDKNISPLF